MTRPPLLVGSETQSLDAMRGVSGIPRVTREAHTGLDAALRPLGVELVPVHTRPSEPKPSRPPDDYLAADPVLARTVHHVDDVQALLMLSLTMTTDFGLILRLRRTRPLPTVALVHDTLPLQRPDWFLPRAREHYRAYLQQLLHVSDHVVVASEAVRTSLLGLGWRIPGEIHVIQMGSSFPQQPPTPAPPEPLGLLYVSTVAPRKGHALLLDAFDELNSRGVAVELTIVGRQGWMADDLAGAITTHSQYGRTLHWHRSATDDDVARIARQCHVAVIPADDEGYGLFLDEGLTLGLKSVARDIPVFRERSDYPNVFFADGSSAGLAEAILRAHATPTRRLAPGTVRSMDDFSAELAELVTSVLP